MRRRAGWTGPGDERLAVTLPLPFRHVWKLVDGRQALLQHTTMPTLNRTLGLRFHIGPSSVYTTTYPKHVPRHKAAGTLIPPTLYV